MMNKHIGLFYFFTAIIVTALVLSGCSSAPAPTPLPTATVKPPPTVVPQPTVTNTPVPPTATPVPPTATPMLPTATPVPPTETLLPPTDTPAPSPATTQAATKVPTTANVGATVSSETPAANAGASPTAVDTQLCLGCHGPFDKLVAATEDYEWQNGSVGTPHKYVPHDSTDIPACTRCHTAHPIPPTASDIAALPEPKPNYCFTCHHTGDLECGTCHEIPAGCKESADACAP